MIRCIWRAVSSTSLYYNVQRRMITKENKEVLRSFENGFKIEKIYSSLSFDL